jgi:hypothetical protein
MDLLSDSVGSGVDVHRIAAQECDERDARLDGKLYSHAHFCMSSNDARPLTSSAARLSGIRSFSSAQPITLSTALWGPMSSRTTSNGAVRIERRRTVQSPCAREDLLG